MKVFIGGIIQETNTFSPRLTDTGTFKRGYILRGEEIEEYLCSTNTEFWGFLDELSQESSVDVIPGFAAWAVAAGPLTSEAFEGLSEELLESLRKRMPVDAVLLALHGALVGEGNDDCDGRILYDVRQVVGPDVPIVSTLDYHACVTPLMLQSADVLVGYRTYPHVDFASTGARAARIAVRLAYTDARPNRSFFRLPLLVPVENTETAHGPMSDALRRIEELEQQGCCMSASVFCTQPWLDVYENGVSALIYDNDGASCDNAVREIMRNVWERRSEFFGTYLTVDSFLGKLDSYESPMIVVDSGDITSAGGLGDSTHILREFLGNGYAGKIILPIVDADAVAKAFMTGQGNSACFDLGSGTENSYNSRTSLDTQVMTLSDLPVKVKGASFSGLSLDMGRRAVLKVSESIDVLVCEHSSLIHDPEILRSMGYEPGNYDVIVQKSHKLFREAYKDIARSVVILDTPGFTTMNLKSLPFRKIRRPVYPLDDIKRFGDD